MNASGAIGRLLVGLAVVALVGGCASGTSPTSVPDAPTPARSPSAAAAIPAPTPTAAATPAPTPSVVATYHLAYESANKVLVPGELDVYAPAKAGLEALTRLLAVHAGHRGITVNSVRPGATATDMNKGASDPEVSRRVAETIALHRVGQPDDIARVVAFLASPDAGWITGQQIDASGGQRL